MENLKDEMNATALAGQQGAPAKRIAGESNREYVLQKTPLVPLSGAMLRPETLHELSLQHALPQLTRATHLNDGVWSLELLADIIDKQRDVVHSCAQWLNRRVTASSRQPPGALLASSIPDHFRPVH